ncbi:uncharacterized protein LOC113312516 [Papaver somniferum]|uniref:uncharacterized protein LOC113312516 n=1 Tax=Papaver somniferum TaxID=3469 RepID=UPI000E6FA2C4|nr:uncharacterized protein LOC113312516 [Papaver somniferum]
MGNEEVENENVGKDHEENEDEENENDGEDRGVGNENETEAQAKPKRKYVPRGPTRMSALGLTNGKNGKEVVSFNNKDHPIGDPSVQLASVLGVLVRRNIALKHRDWRLVPKEAKDNIWAVVQQRFVVDEFYKDYYVGKMGCYLKEYRSRKAGKILALDELDKEEREKKLAALKPDNSTVNEWKEFVKHVCSEEFRTKRFRMQQIRKKYTTPHTISRLRWERLEAKMQKERKTQEEIDRVKVWTAGHKQKEGKEPNPGVVEALEKIQRAAGEHGADVGSSVTDDLLDKSLGDDKPGRLRGIGYGATKTKMVVKTYYKKIIKECRDSMKEVNERLALLEEKTWSCVCHGASHLHNVSPKSGNASNVVGSTSMNVPHHENDSPISRPMAGGVLEKSKAWRLLSWYNENEVVADAIIAETDPNMKCHGEPIGFAAYKVIVTTSIVDDVILYKQSGELKTVFNVVGTYTTWAKDLILPAI